MAKFSEQEIDSILESVDNAMAGISQLAKSSPMERPAQSGQIPTQASSGGAPKTPSGASMAQSPDPMKNKIAAEAPKSSGNVSMAQKPDPMKKDAMNPSQDEETPPQAGGEAPAPAGGEAAPTDDAPAMGAEGGEPAAPGQEGDQGLEGEQSGDAPLSDDELHEIYASMDPAELERHFMIIRSLLQSAYGGAEQGAPEAGTGAPPAPEAGQGAPMAMSERGTSDLAKNQLETDGKLKQIEKENQELRKSLEKVVSAMEVAFAPTRKAVTDIAFIQKGEQQGEAKELTKHEITHILTEKSRQPGLSKADRDAINDYLLRGESKERVLEIVKGGK